MKLLFILEPDFFVGHLNGVRIPLFLRMFRAAREGAAVHAALGEKRVTLCVDTKAENMDAAYASTRIEPIHGAVRYDVTIFQKGRRLPKMPGTQLGETVLMLNDARARQATNQFYELLSGHFGFDIYRMSAPLRYCQGVRRDRAQMAKFNVILVQTAPEADFLRRKAPRAHARIEIFNNAVETCALFPGSIRLRGDDARPHRFLLPVPPGIRREPEYISFLRYLARQPELVAQVTVLAHEDFARHVPQGASHDSNVPDFQDYLSGFDCVLIPTKHYTGLNNRVFQAAAAGCDVIASPEALEGLIPKSSAQKSAPRDFFSFCQAMKAYPQSAISPASLLVQ